MPIMESRKDVRAYSDYRDKELNVKYDTKRRRCMGGTGAAGDVKENSTLAKEIGISIGGAATLSAAEDEDLAKRCKELERENAMLVKGRDQMAHALDLAVKEVSGARHAFYNNAQGA